MWLTSYTICACVLTTYAGKLTERCDGDGHPLWHTWRENNWNFCVTYAGSIFESKIAEVGTNIISLMHFIAFWLVGLNRKVFSREKEVLCMLSKWKWKTCPCSCYQVLFYSYLSTYQIYKQHFIRYQKYRNDDRNKSPSSKWTLKILKRKCKYKIT